MKFSLHAIRSLTPGKKSNGSGFSFRLEERAEKRREVVVETLKHIDIELHMIDINPILSFSSSSSQS